MSRGIARQNLHFNCTVSIGGPAGIRVIRQAILGTQFAVDAIEDDGEFLRRGGEEHSAAGGIGNGLDGVFSGGVATIFILHRANQDGVEENAGAKCCLTGGIKIGAAGGFASVGDQHDDAATFPTAALQGLRAEKNRVVKRSAGAIRNPANGILKSRDFVREVRRQLPHLFVEGKYAQAIFGPQNLLNEVRRGVLFR